MKYLLIAVLALPLLIFGQDAEDTTTVRDYLIDEIVVTARRTETLLNTTPEVIRVINFKEITRLNPTSVGEVLNYVSGINIEGGTGSGLPKRSIVHMNGFPANYNLVLVDGVRLLSDHVHTGQNVELVPVDNIEQIEVIRGASSAQYGSDALGGIINIITKKAKNQSNYSVQLTQGSYGTYSGGVSALSAISADIKNAAYAGWEESKGVEIVAPVNRVGKMGYNSFSFMDKLNISLAEKTSAYALLNYVYNKNQWTTGYQYSYLLSPTVGLDHEITQSLRLSGKMSYIKWIGQQSKETNILSNPEIFLNYTGIKDNYLLLGMDYKNSQFTRTSVAAHNQAAYGVFVQDEYLLSKAVSAMAAVRFDKVASLDAVISPKVSFLIKPVGNLSLRASAGQGFHAPSLQELYELGYGHGGRALRFGNENLKPEYSTNFTFGSEYLLRHGTTFMVNTYYSRMKDMIVPVFHGAWDLDKTKDVWMRENIHKASMYGAEVIARTILFDNYTIEGGYTYSRNKNEETGRHLPYNPGSSEYVKLSAFQEVTGNISFTVFAGVKLAQGRSAWNWTPAKGVAVDDPSGTTTALRDYQKLDAGVNINFFQRFSFFVNVYNILGQEIDELDDAYTVYKGEANYKSGIKYQF